METQQLSQDPPRGESWELAFLLKRHVNPDYVTFVRDTLTGVQAVLASLGEHSLLAKISEGLQAVKAEIKDVLASNASFVEDAPNALQQFGVELQAYRDVTNAYADLVSDGEESLASAAPHLYAEFVHFRSRVDGVLWRIRKKPYPHLFISLLGLVIAFFPFLNMGSIIIGVGLLIQRDWRSILMGAAIAVVLFIQLSGLAVVGFF